MKRSLLRNYLLGLCLFVGTASASTLVVSEQGTWASACPASMCASQSDTWAYSFIVSSNPSPLFSVAGQYTVDSISNFEFYDNGVIVPAFANGVTAMYFYSTAYAFGAGATGGGLSYEAGTSIQIIVEGGAQLYQGSENGPSFLPGTFVTPQAAYLAPFPSSVQFALTSPGPISITTTPEPKTGLLLGFGCIGCFAGLVARKRNGLSKI